jgi:hypothetical protein
MTYWIAAAIASAFVKVGRDCHGFYRRFAENSIGIQFHLIIVDRLTKVTNFIPFKTTYSRL